MVMTINGPSTYRRLNLQTFQVTDFSGPKIYVQLAAGESTYKPEKHQNGTKTAQKRPVTD